MQSTRIRKVSIIAGLCGLFVVLSLTVFMVTKYATRAESSSTEATDAERISALLTEMEATDIASLPALPMEPYTLPPAGVDVMRVRLEESYDIAGVGKDTVELSGWIAVKHFNTRAVDGETEVKWGTAVTDTEFVGMDLRGNSKIFGPVIVNLNIDQRTIGQVGKLSFSFPVGTMINIAYREQTGELGEEIRPTKVVAKASPGGQMMRMKGENAAVERVIRGVLAGVSNKDPKAMLRFYDQSRGNLFFGMTDGRSTSAEEHINSMSQQFEGIRSIKATPDDDMKIDVSGNLATAALTGVNTVVNNEGVKLDGRWRWTVVLAKKGNSWLITHDHIDFYTDPNAPAEMRELQAQCSATARAAKTSAAAARACSCVATVAVNVQMPKLNLRMATARPVLWYSQVATIPPIGFTASVLLTPTPMISDGREVATMRHGAVKFREVVKFLPLREPKGIDPAGQ